MASTNDLALELIAVMGPYQDSNQFYLGGNHQPRPPIQDDSKDEYWKYIVLYRAAMKGDWRKAKEFIQKDQNAVTANVNAYLENALQVAVQAGDKAIDFVKNLVEEMSTTDLEHENSAGETVLHYAASAGNTCAAKILVGKHPGLLYIPDVEELLPVHQAAEYDQKDTFQYLLSATRENLISSEVGVGPFAGISGVRLVKEAIFSGYYDEALKLIRQCPKLAILQTSEGDSALSAIVSKESAFLSGSHLSFWEKVIYFCVPVKLDKHRRYRSEDPVPEHNLARTFVRSFCIPVSQRLQAILYKILAFLVPPVKCIGDKKQEHYQAVELVKLLCQKIATLDSNEAYEKIVKVPLLSAAKLGINEVVEKILDLFPDAVWFADEKSRFVFDLAILHRQKKVFDIIYQMDVCKQLLPRRFDDDKNNMLHFAGRLAPQSKLNRIPGAALQMQSELQWFKEVENLVPPKFRLQENGAGKLPAVLFTEHHEDLVRKGEKWMKDAANSCTIVASLISTIAFAAAITVPGGNDDSGHPNFSKESAFIVFTISNALSLFAAATSLLMFLSIFTSRYEERDFLYALPRRLIIGLVALFLSITTMMVSFTATLYLVTGQYKEKILLPAVAVASVPICIFMSSQFPLLLDLIYSTYGTIFRKKNDRPIFLQSPTGK